MNKVITIGRQYGSGGREIGQKVAEYYGIPFYDNELITRAAKESGFAEENFAKATGTRANAYNLLIAVVIAVIIVLAMNLVGSLLISALFIGLGAGMPVPTLVSTVEKGAGETLQGIVLLIGLGSLFGGILEVSGGA